MSHLTEVKSKLTDEQAIRDALEALGVDVVNKLDVRWYRGTQKSDFGVSFDRPTLDKLGYDTKTDDHYDVGFKRSEDGTYEIICDSELYHHDTFRGLKSPAFKLFGGAEFSTLKEQVNAQKLATIYRRKGFSISISPERRADGALKLTVSR